NIRVFCVYVIVYLIMLSQSKEDKKWKKIEVFVELLVFGIVIGIVEDLLAIKLTTGEPITLKIIGIVVLIAIPFAIIGEVVFDNINLEKYLRRWFGRKKK